jgi:uncharacterized protein involved in exopolysaccharide biosynthesis
MLNKYWRKRALLLAAGALLGSGLGGCLPAVWERILTAVMFD